MDLDKLFRSLPKHIDQWLPILIFLGAFIAPLIKAIIKAKKEKQAQPPSSSRPIATVCMTPRLASLTTLRLTSKTRWVGSGADRCT